MRCFGVLGFCIIFMVACKLQQPHPSRSPSDLKALYDDQHFLLRAHPLSEGEGSVVFEVCMSEGLAGELKEGSCVPAFLSADEKPVVFSAHSLSKGFTLEDAEFVRSFNESYGDHMFARHLSEYGAPLGAAAAMMATTVSSVLVVDHATTLVYQAARNMGHKAWRQVVRVGFLPMALLASGVVIVSASGGTFMAVNGLAAYLKKRDAAPKNTEVSGLGVGPDLLQNQVSYRDLSAVAKNWKSVISEDSKRRDAVSSVFHILRDMGLYLKRSHPYKNIARYCYPSKGSPSLEPHCQSL